MQRLLSTAALGAALIALCASSATWSAEVDFNTLAVAPEPEQSSAPAQAQAWVSPHPLSNTANDAGSGPVPPDPVRREEGAESGGAMFTPFSSAAPTPSTRSAAARHGPAAEAPQGTGAADLVLTLLAVLAGVGAIAWLLRRA
ncbi:hypothetical protein VAR608DRAFT_2071 [Variovorax sp. HW608]|uniref:hypothetical protein n=1 Tax=Variovorax sp. HW608 TaxID=1034889 RepID=UPI00081FE754|nr:hypothetical protein [Variovorax sp. HW608]SCK25640.1 hypothetical protein VAR608DRAFT_2071 [Variovorax sp. HW608]